MRNKRVIDSIGIELEQDCDHDYQFVSFVEGTVVEECSICNDRREVDY